jgi:hypothetical protein
MNTRPMVVAAFLLSLGIAMPARGQIDLKARTSISMEQVPPKVIFGSVATLMHFQVSVDPLLRRPASLTLEDVMLQTLLNAACDSIGCRWRVDGNQLTVEALPQDPTRGKTWFEPRGEVMPAGSRFSTAPVHSVLAAIGQVASGECVIQELDARRTVTVDITNLDVIRAMVAVARAAGAQPGTPLTMRLNKPGQKPLIIHSSVPR